MMSDKKNVVLVDSVVDGGQHYNAGEVISDVFSQETIDDLIKRNLAVEAPPEAPPEDAPSAANDNL